MWARYWLVLKCTQTEGGVHWLDLPECISIRMGQVTGASGKEINSNRASYWIVGKRNQFESGKLLDRLKCNQISHEAITNNLGALLVYSPTQIGAHRHLGESTGSS